MQAVQSPLSSSLSSTGPVSSYSSTQTTSTQVFQFANLSPQEVMTWKIENARLIELEFQHAQMEIVNGGKLKMEMVEKLTLDEQAIQDPTKAINQCLDSIAQKIAQTIKEIFHYPPNLCNNMSKDISKERFKKLNILGQIHGKNESDRTINLGARSRKLVEDLCREEKYDLAKLVAERMIDPRWKVRFLGYITDAMLSKKHKETTSQAYAFIEQANLFDCSNLRGGEIVERLRVIVDFNTAQIESDLKSSEERTNCVDHREKIDQVSTKGNADLSRLMPDTIHDTAPTERSLAPITLNLTDTAPTVIPPPIVAKRKSSLSDNGIRESIRTPERPSSSLTARQRVPNSSLSQVTSTSDSVTSETTEPPRLPTQRVVSRCKHCWNNSNLFRLFSILTVGLLPLFVWILDCLFPQYRRSIPT